MSCGFPDVSISDSCRNGDCLSLFGGQGVCLCKKGYTGRSDWLNLEGYDCHVSEVAIKALWGLVIFMVVLNYAASFSGLRVVYKKFFVIQQHAKSQGKKYTLFDNAGAFSLTIEHGLTTPCMLIMAVYKLADDAPRIGVDVGITVLWMLFRFCFYLGIDVYQTGLFSQMLKGERGMQKYIVLNTWLTHLTTTIAVGAQFLVIPVLANPRDLENAKTFVALYYATCTTAWLAISLQAVVVKNKVDKVLMVSYNTSKDEKTLHVRDQLILQQNAIIKSTALQFVIYLSFAAVQQLYSMHDYLLPVTWCFANLAIIQEANAIGHRYADAQSSKGGARLFGSLFGKSAGVRRRSQHSTHGTITASNKTGSPAGSKTVSPPESQN